ncbi:MAG: Xaa-Pro peptidase family protein [candidate division Zixibacteria bacterium]|nr:Xaa-Pro peptidase family protein [candidate division Zixibacteria bacterium]
MRKSLLALGMTVFFAESLFGLPKEIFKQRRAKLLELMGDGVAVLYGKTGGFEGEFEQDKNFYYLTGVEEPGAILILAPKEKSRREVLLLTPRNPEDERWSGERPSIGRKLEDSLGFEFVGRTGGLGWMVNAYLQHTGNLCYLAPPVSHSSPVPPDLNFYKDVTARVPGTSIKNMSHFIRDMRAIKTDEELAAMQKAIDITGEAFRKAALTIEPGMTEREVQDVIENGFRAYGARHLAFPSIVATGKNTTTLHYTRNDAAIKTGDLFLMDIGAEYDHYAGDVSRTIPVSGKFSPEQRKIYEIVLKAQKAAMAKVKPGAYIREDIHAEAKRVIEEAGYGEYFIHGTSHFIGLDVHDVGDYGSPLKPGMVISVEPGIYLPEKGIGVRIEDDVLVTKTGYKLLTGHIPREIEEIEKLLSGK